MGLIGILLGLVLGSFALVLADRGLTKKTFWGRSYCPHCKKNLRWYDLFPILSYIFLKGKCRFCKKRINIEYLLVEVVMGALIGFLFWRNFVNFSVIGGSEVLIKIFFITVLIVLFITDLRKMLIPDRIILPSLKIGFLLIFATTAVKIGYLYYYLSRNPIGRHLLPPASDYFYRHALYSAYPFLTGILMMTLIGGFFWLLIIITRGKGMGGGDVKLGAFIGLMLGFPQSLVAIMSSFILGAIFSLFLIAFKKKHFGQSIPFGPFLVLGSLISLFWGKQIIDWYLRLNF